MWYRCSARKTILDLRRLWRAEEACHALPALRCVRETPPDEARSTHDVYRLRGSEETRYACATVQRLRHSSSLEGSHSWQSKAQASSAAHMYRLRKGAPYGSQRTALHGLRIGAPYRSRESGLQERVSTPPQRVGRIRERARRTPLREVWN